MKKFAQVILLLSFTIFTYANVEIPKDMVIELGNWEGIDNEYQEYKILQLTPEGKHRLWHANIVSDFQIMHYLPFTNESITCNNSQCMIKIKDPFRKSTMELVVAPSYTNGPLTVLEKAINDSGEAIVSTTYELQKKEGQSTYRSFWDRHKTRLQNIQSKEKNGLSGFWIGTLEMDDQVDLLVLDMPYQSTSQFIRYLPFGKTTLTNETTFESNNIEKIGDAMRVTTTHKTFANQILMHHSSKNILVGHIYSYHKGNLLQTGQFRVKRVD